ncbi:hypothetical protein GQ457_05G004220 [Hibiscus cannabinus]
MHAAVVGVVFGFRMHIPHRIHGGRDPDQGREALLPERSRVEGDGSTDRHCDSCSWYLRPLHDECHNHLLCP